VIFLKDIAQNREIIDQFAIDLSSWSAQEVDLLKMGPVQITPYRNYFRADTLNSLELYEPAMSELKEALKISPNYGAAYHLYGQIYMKLGRYDEAFNKIRIAATFFPDHKQIRLDLADCYKELKAYDEALREARIFVGTWPSDLNGHYILAEIYIAQDDFESVLKQIDEIMALKPKASEDLIALGDLALEKKEIDTAEMIYTAALKTNAGLDQAHHRLGDLFQQIGDEEKAQHHFQQAELNK
jgi:tetratricopeptide (TPR) repeat protein